jgi:deoxyribodipyrimidine photo-lyase
VFWRTYFKGWLEMRPSIWTQYREGVRRGLDRVATEGGLRADWEAACHGETGIDCFDHWARELVETGYLHNHARMWFASIWTFTLRLPWELGADFFLRHLLDGDPASNTLGWRSVAGLQTRGKNYLARAANIARYTEGRFNPAGQLNETAAPLEGPQPPPRMAPPEGGRPDPDRRTGWLVTEDDLCPGFALESGPQGPVCVLTAHAGRSPLDVSEAVDAFTRGAADDTVARLAERFGEPERASGAGRVEAVCDWVARHDLQQIALPYAPTGPAADTVRAVADRFAEKDVRIVRCLRDFDAQCWPHATAGFFKFKDKIPRFVATLKGLRAA